MEQEIQEMTNPNSKMNTCVHRSAVLRERVIKRCTCKGGDYTIRSYSCEKRQIIELSDSICERCPLYSPK
jgi:hypothetical protein